MALSATIYKANIVLSNLNKHFYNDFSLTMAKHPSENIERMMFRLVSFLNEASETLEFTKGLSDVDQPEIWEIDHSGDIVKWIELGTPDEKRIKQALSKSKEVIIYTYHYNKSKQWFEKLDKKLTLNKKLTIYHLNIKEDGPLEALVQKNMELSSIIEDGVLTLSNDQLSVSVDIFLATTTKLSRLS